MQPRSALFDATIAGPHQMLVAADILSGGRVVATGLGVVSGSVTGNRKQFARRTCTVVVEGPAWMPVTQVTGSAPDEVLARPALYPSESLHPSESLYPSDGVAGSGGGSSLSASTDGQTIGDLLTPYGNEIRLWRGAVTPAGPELICVGTFGIRSVEYDTGADFSGITVTGIDRCKAISETRFPYPRNSNDSNTSAIGLISQLIYEVFPWATIRVDPKTWDVGVPPVTWKSDRDEAITDLAASIGAEVFCDPLGEFVIQPIPSINSDPVYTVTGGPGGVLVSARHSLSRDGVFNGVIARGSTTASDQEPVESSLFVDTDSTSPTWWDGPFGRVVGFYDSSLITARDQAQNAAQALLLDQVGRARSINYAQLVHPALDLGDVVAVVDPDTGITERHLTDQLTIPLELGGTMTAQTRSYLGVTSPVVAQYADTSLS